MRTTLVFKSVIIHRFNFVGKIIRVKIVAPLNHLSASPRQSCVDRRLLKGSRDGEVTHGGIFGIFIS